MMPPLQRWCFGRDPVELLQPILRGPDIGDRLVVWSELLRSGQTLGSLAADVALGEGDIPGLTAADVDHFTTHWLEEWFGDAPVEPILRHGLRIGFEKAIDLGLPVDVLVVRGVQDVQVGIAEGPGQVTIIIAIPTVEAQAASPRREPGTLTVVGHVRDTLSDENAGGTVEVLEEDDRGQVVAVQLSTTI
jgi:hypothetical protein